MILIKFKNLEKSELAKEAVMDRIQSLIDKFPDLDGSRLQVTLEMENSPIQAGPDLFKVKFYISRGRYEGLIIEKANSNLYIALAEVIDHALELLNRFGDRKRVKERKLARKINHHIEKTYKSS